MALDTSSGAYEQLYDSSTPESNDEYYSGYIEMKGKFGKWSQYWCVLKKQNLHFFKDVNTQVKDNYVGYFQLEMPTSIEIKGAKEWMIKTKTKKITLRMQISSLRESWIQACRQSLSGEPPTKEDRFLPGSGPASPPTSPAKQSSCPDQSSQAQVRSSSRKDSLKYIMTEEQKKGLNEQFARNVLNAPMTDVDLRIQDQLLKEKKNWYQGVLRREDVARILKDEKNGTFIVRDYIDVSSSRNMGYVISLKDQEGEIRHHKILKTVDGLIINGYENEVFDTLPNLLRFFITSQRKKVILVPYKPKLPQMSEDPQYEIMGGDQYEKMNSAQVDGYFNTTFPITSPSRSVSDRSLPPIPPDPSPGMARAEFFQQRALPTLPASNGDSYVEMTSPKRSLPPLPSEEQTHVLPLRLPDDASGYINVPPPSSGYINIPGGGFGFPEEELAPKLPPKNRSSSVKEVRPYVNVPGRSDRYGDRPPRPPLRKAFTLERM